MSNPEILEKEPVNLTMVKEALKKVKKQDEELNFRAQRTEEYVNEVVKLKPKEAKELVDKLVSAEIPRLKPQHIQKIVDTLPINEKHLKVVLQGTTVTISADNQKKIAAIVAEHRK